MVKQKKLKNDYFKREWERAGSNHKKQWKFINSLIKPNKIDNNIYSLIIDDRILDENNDNVNSLNHYLVTVGERISNQIELYVNSQTVSSHFEDIVWHNNID